MCGIEKVFGIRHPVIGGLLESVDFKESSGVADLGFCISEFRATEVG